MSRLSPLMNSQATQGETLPENSLKELEQRLIAHTNIRKELESDMSNRKKHFGKGDAYYEMMDRWTKISELEAELIILVGLYKQRQENAAIAQPKSKASLSSGGTPRLVKTKG